MMRWYPSLLTLQLQVKSPEVGGIHRRGGPLEQRSLGRCFGEGNHISERLGSGQQHDDSVHAEGETAVRGRTGTKALQQEPESLLSLLLGNAEEREDAALEIRISNSKTATAELGAIQHHVVGQRSNLFGGPLE